MSSRRRKSRSQRKNSAPDADRQALRAAKRQHFERQKTLSRQMDKFDESVKQLSERRRQISANRRQVSERRRQVSANRRQVSERRHQVSAYRRQLSVNRRKLDEQLQKLNADRRQFSAERKRGGGAQNRVDGECPVGCVKDKRKKCKSHQYRGADGRCRNIVR